MFREWLEKKLLRESMDIYIQGYQDNSFRTLDDVAYWVKQKVLNPAWNKLTPEQQEAVRQGGSLHHGMITPDGDYYASGEKTINFYTAGWPQEMIPKIIQGIKYFLDQRKVKYGFFKDDKSGMYESGVIRIPVLQVPSEADIPARVNLANANAVLIFKDILGYSEDNGGFFNIDPRELLMKIDNLPDYTGDLHQRDPYQTASSGHSTMWHGGYDKETIQDRLQRIRQIAQWAIDHGYDEIYVA